MRRGDVVEYIGMRMPNAIGVLLKDYGHVDNKHAWTIQWITGHEKESTDFWPYWFDAKLRVIGHIDLPPTN